MEIFYQRKFIERVHLQWVDQECHGNTWPLERKEKYRQYF